MVRRAIALIVLATFVSVGFALVSQYAEAATGQTSADNGVLYESCQHKDYDYSISPDYSDWDLSVSLIGPDGTEESSDYLFSPTYSTSGTGSFLFCGSERPGTYTILAELTEYDSNYHSFTVALPSSMFQMRKPRSRTTLTASTYHPRFNGLVTLKAIVREERPNGLYGTSYGYVRLEVHARSGWVGVKGGKLLTNGHGVATKTYRWNVRGPVRLRARALPDNYTGSYSRTITVKAQSGRGRPRTVAASPFA